jgi:hypothetical protein
LRAAFVIENVTDADLFRIKLPRNQHTPVFRLINVNGFRLFGSPKLADKIIASGKAEEF